MPLTRDSILEMARSLPPGLKQWARMEQLRRRDPEPTLDEIAELFQSDAGLTEALLQVSNSVLLGGEQRTQSVQDALLRVGMEEAFLIGGEMMTHRLWDQPLRLYGVGGEQVAQHAWRTAFYAERLALDLQLDDRAAYLAGMLAPLGMWALEKAAPRLANVAPFSPDRDRDVREWELRHFGCESVAAAAVVLTAWGFPPELAAVVGDQRLTEPAARAHRMAHVLNLARGAAAVDAPLLAGELPFWRVTPEKLANAGFSAAGLARALGTIREEFRQAAEHPLRRAMAAHRVAVGDFCNFRPRSGVLSPNDALSVHTSEPGVKPAPDFPTFMRNYQNMVFSTAARLTGNDAQAEDISQEVFLKAYDHFDQLCISPTAGGWLKTVATNLSLNHLARYRKRWRFFSEFRRDSDGGDDADAPAVDFAAPDTFFSEIDAEDRRELVEQALAQLPVNQRVPLVLFHFEDMPYDEIAKKLGVSLAKVKTDILRARAALAKILVRHQTAHEPFKL